MLKNKKRIDLYLVEQGYFETRERAKAQIMAGNVFINGQKENKAGSMIKDGDKIEIRGNKLRYVSRGGLKLEKAINKFGIDLKDKICLDIGASTGGFTDCMLQNGAKKVYAIDVGYGQLAWKLREDKRVINKERTNIRYFNVNEINDEIDFITVDVSFISLKLVLPIMKSILKTNKDGVCLIKPQFEAGREEVGKKGVIKDIKIHKKVICDILEYTHDKIGFSIVDIDYSPIKGPEGNIEYLMYIKNIEVNDKIKSEKIEKVVEESHKILGQKS